MRRFWVVLYTFTALCHIPFALGLHHILVRAEVPGAPWIALLAALAAAALLRGRVGRGMADQPLPAWRRRLVEEPYYVHWCATVAAFLLFIPGLAVLMAGGVVRGAFAEVSAGKSSGAALGSASVGALAAALYATGLGVAGFGVLVRRRWLRVRTIDVSVAGLGAAFEGYRIAHLSDLHIGSMLPREQVDRWVDRANALGVDLVALTGDYVTSGVAFHEDIAAALGRLCARDGAVAVMGNHDYFGDGEPLVSLLRRRGVAVLRNEHIAIERDGERLTIAGVDDTWTRRADVDRALAGRHPAAPTVALAHDPALFPALAELGASLVLSGHTHWGQIGAPFLAARFNLARLAHRFHAGLYRLGDATLYVHPGMGTTGPPIRVGVAPELTILRLHRARSVDVRDSRTLV